MSKTNQYNKNNSSKR